MEKPEVLPETTVTSLPAAGASGGRVFLTPEAWVAAATDVLEFEGIAAVRIHVLAKTLDVTRGSFYWHFKDRDDLLRAVLQAWRQATTDALTHRLALASTEPRDQLRDVLSLPFRGRSAARAARIELSLRAWARRDDMARRAVDEADTLRVGYIAQIFSGLGFDLVEARTRAQIIYGLNVACALVTPSVVSIETVLDAAERLLVRRDD